MNDSADELLVIYGPTATGKTAASIELAQRLGERVAPAVPVAQIDLLLVLVQGPGREERLAPLEILVEERELRQRALRLGRRPCLDDAAPRACIAARGLQAGAGRAAGCSPACPSQRS